MTRKKKGILLVSVLLVICLLTSAVAVVAKKANESVVTVIPVESIYMESYVESTNVEGNVATSATQKVKVAKDTTIEQVYVKQGDRVHKGEKLVTFDMTLTELELSIAQLTKKSQELQLDKAKKSLTNLENGGPIEEEEYNADDIDAVSYTHLDVYKRQLWKLGVLTVSPGRSWKLSADIRSAGFL